MTPLPPRPRLCPVSPPVAAELEQSREKPQALLLGPDRHDPPAFGNTVPRIGHEQSCSVLWSTDAHKRVSHQEASQLGENPELYCGEEAGMAGLPVTIVLTSNMQINTH